MAGTIEVEVGYGFPEADVDEVCVSIPGVPGYGPQHTRGQTCSTCAYAEEFETKPKRKGRKSSVFGRSKGKRKSLVPQAPKPKLVIVYDCELFDVEVGAHCTCDSWTAMGDEEDAR
jgi:hypothetical protein